VDFADFTIFAGSKEFRVHKRVLAAQSSVFANMLKNDEQVKATSKFEIEDFSKEVVKEFLRSFYTIDNARGEHALELFRLACKFKFEDLMKANKTLVIKNLDEHNAIDVLKLGNQQKSNEIIKAAFSHLKKVFPNEIKSDALKHKPERVEEIVKTVKRYKMTTADFIKSIEHLNKN
jgi:BTB/POZ domain